MPEQTFPQLNAAQGILPRICPQLGLHDDRATRYGYPSTGNYCFKSGHPIPVELDKQSTVCLCQQYSSCSVFQGGQQPVQPRRGGIQPAHWKRIAVLTGILITTGVLIAYIYPLITHSRAIPDPSATAAPSQLANINSLPATPAASLGTPTATIEIEPSSTPLPSASPTIIAQTPTVTLYIPTTGPLPGTPFGPAKKFFLYVVRAGDSLTNISENFNTSPHVLLASNVFKDGRALWPGDVLLILPGVTDPQGVTRFMVVELASSIGTSELAIEHNISVDDLKKYNSLGSSATIPAGRLVIIPIP